MRTAYRKCKYCGDYHNLAAWPPNHRDPAPQRSALPAPMIISDTMDLLWHPADGKYYDSKAQMRAVAKAHNLIEVGTDTQKENIELDIVHETDVMEAIAKVEQGYKPQAAEATQTGEGWATF